MPYLPSRGNTTTMMVLFSRVRLIHCPLKVLTSVISPNAESMTAGFVVVGDVVNTIFKLRRTTVPFSCHVYSVFEFGI